MLHECNTVPLPFGTVVKLSEPDVTVVVTIDIENVPVHLLWIAAFHAPVTSSVVPAPVYLIGTLIVSILPSTMIVVFNSARSEYETGFPPI